MSRVLLICSLHAYPLGEPCGIVYHTPMMQASKHDNTPGLGRAHPQTHAHAEADKNPPADAAAAPAENGASNAPADAALNQPAGQQFDLSDPSMDHASQHAVLRQAVDFRGDVTVKLTDDQTFTGYAFDYRPASPNPAGEAHDNGGSSLRLIPNDRSERIALDVSRIRQILFASRDPAAGRSWETWVKKYKQGKASGQAAEMEPMPLDE